MSASGPPKMLSPAEKLVLDARPAALKVAHMIARLWGVRSRALLADCEQAAAQAQLEALPGYDKARGPFEVYQWKRVAGAVTRLLRREQAGGTTGFDDALDETDDLEIPAEPDPFSAEDSDDLKALKGLVRVLTFRRLMGDTRAALQASPDNEALRAQVFGALQQALGELDERQRRVIEHRYWEGLDWETVGARMGVSERHAKRIDNEIRDLLKGDLRRRGIDEPPPSGSL